MELKTFLRANWDRALAVVLVVTGGVALLLGWIGISGTGLVAQQNPYLISGGVVGIALIAIGCTIWLSSDMQDEWRRLDALEERLEAIEAASATPAGSSFVDEVTANGGTPELVDAVTSGARTPRKRVARVAP